MSEYMAGSYPISKDPAVAAYLQYLKERNIEKASKCYICGGPTTGINADGYSIFFTCDEHSIEKVRVIVDESNPHVMHFIYPDGKPVDKAMMDPNIGGYIPRDGSVDYKNDIWSTQTTFE